MILYVFNGVVTAWHGMCTTDQDYYILSYCLEEQDG